MEAALLDPHTAIRQAARRFLSRQGSFDFAAFYRGALSNPGTRTLASALAGLGETAPRENAALVAPFLSHRLSRVRLAAVRALGKLDARSFLPRFLDVVRTDPGRAAKEARDILRTQIAELSSPLLREEFNAAGHIATKLAFLDLLAARPKWESPLYLLEAADGQDDAVRSAAPVYLDRWIGKFNRSFTQPTAGQLQEIRQALERAGEQLDPKTRKQLDLLTSLRW